MVERIKEHWGSEPAAHDFPAAADYLSLLLSPDRADSVVEELRRLPVVNRKAKDLLRASGLPLLPRDDAEVVKDLSKVKRGVTLSPVLILRGSLASGRPLTIADGYHRICASYYLNENAEIPCRIADLPS